MFILTLESELLSKDGTDVSETGTTQCSDLFFSDLILWLDLVEQLIEDDSDKEVEPGFERPVAAEPQIKKRPLVLNEEGPKQEEKEDKPAAQAPAEAGDDDEGEDLVNCL